MHKGGRKREMERMRILKGDRATGSKERSKKGVERRKERRQGNKEEHEKRRKRKDRKEEENIKE